MNFLFARVVLVCAVLGAAQGLAAELPIIAKARAQLGTDATLDGVHSLHYVGTLVSADPVDSTKQIRQRIEIFLQKPFQQRIVVTSENVVEISALDNYDAWRRVIDAKDPSRWQQTQMSAEQIKQLRADVWQNLSYFRGIEKIGGFLEDIGTEKIEGALCRKIAFHHGDTVVNFRCFDDATGKLIYTGTPNYNTREQGEMNVAGIRFPKALLITQLENGRPVTRTLTFEKVTVNETLPASLFAVPMANTK